MRRNAAGQATTPRAEGFRMPAEWEPHQCCFMAWPTRQSLWGEMFGQAKLDYAEVARAILEQNRVTLFAAHPRAQKTLPDVDLTRKFALIVGAEGRGVSDRLKAAATEIRIPTTTVESLNAATAAGVILYEASRQRMFHT